MKKIMFNDNYGLTEAVLQGEKTMTRRAIVAGNVESFGIDTDTLECIGWVGNLIVTRSRYKIGEKVAIVQPYCKLSNAFLDERENKVYVFKGVNTVITNSEGYGNKMFVKADLMPHHIQITNIRIERLQDISDEDCMKEGIEIVKKETIGDIDKYYLPNALKEIDRVGYRSPKEAFSVLIDKVSGKRTWDNNPYVFVYEFKLID